MQKYREKNDARKVQESVQRFEAVNHDITEQDDRTGIDDKGGNLPTESSEVLH